uniref:RING-type domain-containing protein n=1 Tax=Macrostomum lignano TaxID=282301 RepID=A0A1I8F4M5_9PLAT
LSRNVRQASAKASRQELKCPLCRAWFVRPLLLPCGHSLCRDCWAGIQQAPADDQMSVLSETDSLGRVPAGVPGRTVCDRCRWRRRTASSCPANRALERLVSAAAAASSANKDHGSQDCGNDEDVVELNDCRRHPGEPGAFCLSCRGSFACGLCAGEEPCAGGGGGGVGDGGERHQPVPLPAACKAQKSNREVMAAAVNGAVLTRWLSALQSKKQVMLRPAGI